MFTDCLSFITSFFFPSRFRVAITVVGNCLRCLRPCDNVPDSDCSGHYHCPFCPGVFTSQEVFVPHAADHLRADKKQRLQDEQKGGVKKFQRIPLRWNVPPMDAKPKQLGATQAQAAATPLPTVKPPPVVEQKPERTVVRGRASGIPTPSMFYPKLGL